MVTIIDEGRRVSVPFWVNDLEAFRRWTEEDDFPDEYDTWWLCGEVWIDMSKQQVYSHVLVKTEIAAVLRTLTRQEGLGQFFTDGVFLSSFAGDLAGIPDGLYVSNETLASDRIRHIEGKEAGYVEFQGSPDMVLEVISEGSVNKDAVVLKQGYYDAGIREYWLVDARGGELRFDIFRRGARGYVRQPHHDGWVKSIVFGRSFRLTTRERPDKLPDYQLEVRSA